MKPPTLAAATLLAGALFAYAAPSNPATAPAETSTSEPASALTTQDAPATASRPSVSPAQVWDMLFGREATALANRTDRRENAPFAAKIIEAAKQIPDDPASQAFLFLKAYDYGIVTTDGYASASAAMDLLRDLPGQTTLADEKLLALFDLMWKNSYGTNRKTLAAAYAAKAEDLASARLDTWKPDDALAILRKAASAAEMTGGETNMLFQARLKEASHKLTVTRRAAELKIATTVPLSRTKAALEWTELALLEMDRPADVAGIVTFAGDPNLTRTVADAQKKTADLTEQQILDLASWYEAKLSTATDYAKYQTAPHAVEILDQFLAAHAKEDVLRLKAKILRENLLKLRDKAAQIVLREYSQNLLALIDPAKHAVDGTWKIEGGKLTATGSTATSQIRLRIPYRPGPEYDLSCTFKRVDGNDALVLAIPFEKGQADILIGGWGNAACAIENLVGYRRIRNNPTYYHPPGGILKNGTDHNVIVKVRSDCLTVYLDSREIIKLKSDGSDLAPARPAWTLKSPICIALFNHITEISKLEISPITGRGEKLTLPPLPPAR